MIRVLTGVDPTDIKSEILLALMVAEPIWTQLGADVLWVTSMRDGAHKAGSLHYTGLGMDLRVKNLLPALWEKARDALQAALGPRYDVLLEKDPPHIHVEYDPTHVNR